MATLLVIRFELYINPRFVQDLQYHDENFHNKRGIRPQG